MVFRGRALPGETKNQPKIDQEGVQEVTGSQNSAKNVLGVSQERPKVLQEPKNTLQEAPGRSEDRQGSGEELLLPTPPWPPKGDKVTLN